MNYLLKGIDPEFWHRVKVFALERRTTIKALVLRLLEKEIKSNVPK